MIGAAHVQCCRVALAHSKVSHSPRISPSMFATVTCRLPAGTPMYDMLKLFQTGRSHMVVLTDTPATARAAAAAEAAAKAAKAAAEAAAAEGNSEQDDDSSTRLGSMLRGGKKRKERHQYHSPLLQPIPSEHQHSSDRANGGSAARGGAWMVGDGDAQQSSGSNAADSLYNVLYSEQQPLEPPDYTQPSPPSSLGGAPLSSLNGLSSSSHPAQLVREQEMTTGNPSIPIADLGATGSRHAGSHSVVPSDAGAAAAAHSGSRPSDQLHHGISSTGQHPDGVDGLEQIHHSSRGSLHNRSLSGPLPTCMNPLLMGGVSTPENGTEGVAMPIGIITIEDVIEELMQAEIVDETDLFIDNERSVSVSWLQCSTGVGILLIGLQRASLMG